ncbi:MAG: tRNA 2-thiouridine(34) synthase MnmA [Acidimicrobiales bacterium]
MRVLVAMSGGVDSSVAAALAAEAGHDVVGVTLKLWGGRSDTGCCSIADVDDARRVADRLGLDHHVFNFGEEFEAAVVAPYVADHAAGRTPNPCIECNRRIKFDVLLRRAEALGFDALATGHHARVVRRGGVLRVGRGVDAAKDQSYVLHMLDQATLGRLLLPVGELTKAEVRAEAARLGLRTAAKPDSQEVCFVTRAEGRAAFLAARRPLRPARVVDRSGAEVGRAEAVELVTVGQRKGLGTGGGPARYVLAVDAAAGLVTVGSQADLEVAATPLEQMVWSAGPHEGPVLAQCSAHGAVRPAVYADGLLTWARPERRVAPGQSIALYDGDVVLGGGIAG